MIFRRKTTGRTGTAGPAIAGWITCLMLIFAVPGAGLSPFGKYLTNLWWFCPSGSSARRYVRFSRQTWQRH